MTTIEELHNILEKTHYRSGFPGINGRAWTRLHDNGIRTIYDLCQKYYQGTGTFEAWYQETTGVSDIDTEECVRALKTKFDRI